MSSPWFTVEAFFLSTMTEHYCANIRNQHRVLEFDFFSMKHIVGEECFERRLTTYSGPALFFKILDANFQTFLKSEVGDQI